MAIVNPLDKSGLIDITGSLDSVRYPYGVFTKTGLFTPEYVTQHQIIAQIDDRGLGKMTGFTSLRERDAMRTAKQKRKGVALTIPALKIVEEVTWEDFAGIVADWSTLTPEAREETLNEVVLDRFERMDMAMTQNKEYMAMTAAKGAMRDPADGSIWVDMNDVLGTTRITHPLDLTDANLDIISWAIELKAKLQKASKVGSVIPVVDVFVNSADLQAINMHASIAPLRANLLTGLGAGGVATASNILYSTVNLTENGITEILDLKNGVRFMTYPATFTQYDGDVVDLTPEGSAFTVLRGLRDLYRVAYAPAPYLSKLGSRGTEDFVWRTDVKHDQQFEVGHESYPLYYMTQPALAADIVITKAP